MESYMLKLSLRMDRSGMPKGYNGPQIDKGSLKKHFIFSDIVQISLDFYPN